MNPFIVPGLFSLGDPMRLDTAVALAIMLSALVGCSSKAERPGAPDSSVTAAVVAPAHAPAPPLEIPGCTEAAVATGNARSLALLVGVGDYKSNEIPDLHGPPNDVELMYRLLTERYGFPKQNVCKLVDAQATVAGFKAMFEKSLVARAKEGDVAVVYFAGHGSDKPDEGETLDEEDGLDETWVLHDSRTPGVRDLSDDEVNTLLKGLRAQTKNITVILDSCNSGSAHRALSDGTLLERTLPPERASPVSFELARSLGGREAPVAEDDPDIVVLAAASDGTSALEAGGHGIFTDALIEVLGQSSRYPLRYAQAARQIPVLVSARSPQVPYFHGDLDRQVFGSHSEPRPLSWDVTKVDDGAKQLELVGGPLPGMGVGAELRIYDRGLAAGEFHHPGKAKATALVTSFSGLNAKATVAAVSPQPGAQGLRPGDVAVLIRPSDDSLRISVRIRPENEAGGLTAAEAASLRTEVAGDTDAKASVLLTDGSGDFEIRALDKEWLAIVGAEGVVRNRISRDKLNEVPSYLWRHARQKALKQLRGETGGAFVDGQTLQVEFVPAEDKFQGPCGTPRRKWWAQSKPNEEQIIPLCVVYRVKVTVDQDAPTPLLVGGVMLSTDGSTFGFPTAGFGRKLMRGQSYTFPERFRGQLPLDVRDTIRVFGTQENNRVPWYLLTATAAGRRSAPLPAPGGPLFKALDRYLVPGERGQGYEGSEMVDAGAWTATSLTMRVEANPRPAASPDAAASTSTVPAATDPKKAREREYTIPNFDLRPYMPDDQNTALYKVLSRVQELTRDEIPYKQHQGWDAPNASDEQNLKTGIDCSRAIWFAFTRAQLPYNKNNAYLPTASMVATDSAMAGQFDRCDADSRFLLGDVLVYRDDKQGDGHVVMVIDPEKRVAWGSHNWDGNTNGGNTPDRGVEFQLIKYKKDWGLWDRKTMELKACWRYRTFINEARQGSGLPGLNALGHTPCNVTKCSTTQSASSTAP